MTVDRLNRSQAEAMWDFLHGCDEDHAHSPSCLEVWTWSTMLPTTSAEDGNTEPNILRGLD
jgi:hypothetical protein